MNRGCQIRRPLSHRQYISFTRNVCAKEQLFRQAAVLFEHSPNQTQDKNALKSSRHASAGFTPTETPLKRRRQQNALKGYNMALRAPQSSPPSSSSHSAQSLTKSPPLYQFVCINPNPVLRYKTIAQACSRFWTGQSRPFEEYVRSTPISNNKHAVVKVYVAPSNLRLRIGLPSDAAKQLEPVLMHVTLALQEKWREAVLRWLTKLGQRHMEWIYSDSSERSYKKVLLRQCEMEEGMRHVEVEYMIMTDPADEDIDMSDMSAALPEVNEDFDTTDFGDAFADMEH